MRKILTNSLWAVSVVLFDAAAHAAPQLDITSAAISQGNTATIDLGISGLGGGTALGVFDITVDYNPSVVSFGSATFGDPVLGDQLDLEGFGTFQNTTSGAGSAELFELSFDSSAALTSLQSTNFTLAALTFTGVANGTSDLSLSVNALGDQNGDAIPADLGSGSITVGPSASVSEPGPWSLMVAGVTALLLRGRLGRWRLPLRRSPVF
jgi:hypothetical protein